MSNTEIKDIPEKSDDELNQDELGEMSGGVLSTGSLGGIATPSAKAGRTQIEFTGDEVDSQ